MDHSRIQPVLAFEEINWIVRQIVQPDFWLLSEPLASENWELFWTLHSIQSVSLLVDEYSQASWVALVSPHSCVESLPTQGGLEIVLSLKPLILDGVGWLEVSWVAQQKAQESSVHHLWWSIKQMTNRSYPVATSFTMLLTALPRRNVFFHPWNSACRLVKQ